MPDTTVEGSFASDSRVKFFDAEKNGLQAHITQFEANIILTYEYEIDFTKGVGDKDSEASKQWHGCFDRFELLETHGETTLTITSSFPSQFLVAFEPSWTASVQRIKSLAESL